MRNLINFNTDYAKNLILSFYLNGKIIDKRWGTYGVVYIVEQEGFPKFVAYKTIQEMEQIDEERLNRFVREMRQWFKVKGHPLILTPHFITLIGGLPFVCMPFCEMDLHTYLEKRGRLGVIESLTITAQVLKGLIYSKSKGIEAHQDLKPTNILLEDLSEKFKDFPPEDMPFLRYRIRVADFGNANAWKELGKPHGTKPYMAPEQFLKEGDFSKVDVFAIGVILHELLTGRHPIGEKTGDIWPEPKEGFPKKYKHDKVWEKWAMREDKRIEIGDDETSKEIEQLIRNMLLPDPSKRISLEHAFRRVVKILSDVNKEAANQLNLLLEYYDTLAQYFCDYRGRLNILSELSKTPVLRDVIIDEMLGEISQIDGKINTPAEAIYFIELCYNVSLQLLRRNKDEDIKKVEELGKKIILEVINWKEKIKVAHKYPPLKFREVTVIRTPPFRDFEVHAELLNYGRILLEKVRGVEETKKFFEEIKDAYLKALYFYSMASDFNMKGDSKKAIEILDKCIELNSTEPTFYFMKALWAHQYLFTREVLGKLTDEEKIMLTNLIHENLKKATQLAPDWEEPKKLLSSY